MDRRYWIQRISHLAEISTPLLDKGYLCIGYLDFALIDQYLDKLKAGGRSYLDDMMRSEWDCLTRHRHQLWRFLMEMKKGDWVLVPTAGHFSIYELLEDDALLISDLPADLEINDWSHNSKKRSDSGFIRRNEEQIYDLGFMRRVKAVKINISRYDYADAALTSRLKVRQANVEVSDLASSIMAANDRRALNKPLSFRSEIKCVQDTIKNAIEKTLQPDKFEKLVKWYFEKIGASSVYIPSKNSADKEGIEDVDVHASFELLKTIYYVQVKHHRAHTYTGSWAVEQIRAMSERHLSERMDDGYNKIYWVISSAENFEELAIQEAKQCNVQLINGTQFADMLIDAGLHNIDKAF